MAKAGAMEVSREVKPQAKPGDGHGEAKNGHNAYDPSNPRYFGLPLGVIIAAGISATAVTIALLKFF